MRYYIYIIKNKNVENKFYIGSCSNYVSGRFGYHKYSFKNNLKMSGCKVLFENNIDDTYYEILEKLDCDKIHARHKEQEYIDYYKNKFGESSVLNKYKTTRQIPSN